LSLTGLWGRPFVDLAPFLDRSVMPALHEEICLALATVPTSYTGGSHRSMGIVPPSLRDDPRADYGEVIAGLSDAQFLIFASLGDGSCPADPALRAELTFGEERQVQLTERQMRWLEVRHKVYFPWTAYLELMPNSRWSTKSEGRGKAFSRAAQLHFPQTVAYIRSLPFEQVGSVKLLGLRAGADGTVHRDGEPEEQEEPDEFVIFCPAADKRLFLWDEQERSCTFAPSWAYWFNDFDYHGVAADPWFRYSIRVDGRFAPELRQALRP
jgi:hypothetical protein